MLLESRGITDGTTPYVLRYGTNRPVIVEVVEALNETNIAFITLATCARGAPVSAMVGLKQGVTSAAGLGIQWTGQLKLRADEELVALFTNAAASERVTLKVKAQ